MQRARVSLKVVFGIGIVVGICLLSVDALADAPKFNWVQHAGSPSQEHVLDVALDSAGNSYVVGRFDGPNLALGSFTVTGGGLFVAKYDPNGIVLWANQVGPSGVGWNVIGYWTPRIAADNAGNVYLAGTFYCSADFGVTNFTSNCGGGDIFLAKYDTAGNLAWVRRGGNDGVQNELFASAIAVDEAGDCLLTGRCGSASFGTTNFSSDGTLSIFVAKYDSAGDILWIQGNPGSTASFNTPKAITISSVGDYYICGEFNSETLTLGHVTLTNIGSLDVFVTRYDSNGNLLWAKRGGGSNRDIATSVAVDASGACYLAGSVLAADGGYVTNASASFNEFTLTNANFFLVKYDPAGNVVWCRKSAVFERYHGSVLSSVTDSTGNNYLFGQYEGVATFDTITVTNRGGDGSTYGDYASLFLVKYDADGLLLWIKQFGGVYGGETEGWGIAADAAGNCSAASYFETTNAVFDDFTLSRAGGLNDQDVFVARLPADPPRLNIKLLENGVTVSWPTNQPGFRLERADALGSVVWAAVTNDVMVGGAQNFVTNEITAGGCFYRLRKQ